MPELEDIPELERLRFQVKQYEQAERDRLQQLVNSLTIERDHFKNEAYRNADIGRQIDAQAKAAIADLQNQLLTVREANARRSR